MHGQKIIFLVKISPERALSLHFLWEGAEPKESWVRPPALPCAEEASPGQWPSSEDLPQGAKPTCGQPTIYISVVSREQRLESLQKSHRG